jgi:hypothetical protein
MIEFPPSAASVPVQPEADLVSFVDDVRQALRTIDPSDLDRWHEAYEGGLREAYRRNDIEGLVSIAGFAAACLDVQGHSRQALDQLDFAISMAQGIADAEAYLLSLKAISAALVGDPQEARQALARAAESVTPASATRSRLGFEAYAASVACILLDERPSAELTAPIPACEREGLDWLASALRCWYIAYLFATGQRNPALPWIETLRMQEEVVQHPARIADANTFRTAWHAVTGDLVDIALTDSARSTMNTIALWRIGTLGLHQTVLRGDSEAADRWLAILDEGGATLHPAFTDGMEAFRALAGAYRGENVEGLTPPRQPSLVNCAAALAGGEAIAIAGSQEAAATWKAWFDATCCTCARAPCRPASST